VDKKQHKKQQQKSWGLTVDAKMPLVLMSDIDQQILALIEEIVAGISAIGVQVVFVHSSNMLIDARLTEIAQNHPGQAVCISNEDAQQDVFDAAVVDELTADKLEELKQYKRVPISAEGSIKAFDPIAEEGNGFVFDHSDHWSLFAAFVRVSETFRFPYDWSNLIKAVQKS
jgi:glycogen synthase